MPAHKLDFYLNSADPLRNITRAARQLSELQQILAKNAPLTLTQSCCIKQLRDGILVISADNAAVATQLKQLTPRLLAGYQKQGREVTSIRIEVQVASPARRPDPNRRSGGLSVESIENIMSLANRLEASPLKEALNRLAAHARKTP